MRLVGPTWSVFGPVGEDRKNPQIAQTWHQEIQSLLAGGVYPVISS
jgi:hypothetical protein